MYWKESPNIFLSVVCVLLLISSLSFAASPQLGEWRGEAEHPDGEKGKLFFTISDDLSKGTIVSSLYIQMFLPCANGGILETEWSAEGRITINGGKFIIDGENGIIEGEFLTVDYAEGAWNHVAEDPQGGRCENQGTWTATHSFDGSLKLDGTWGVYAYDSPSLAPGDNDWTIEAWVYPTSWPEVVQGKAYATIAGKRGSYELALRFDADEPTAKRFFTFVYGDTAYSIALEDFEPNQWYHIAGILDNRNNTVAICINGEKYFQDEPYTEDLPDTDTKLLVGQPTLEGVEHFNGKITELRISDVVRYPEASFTPPLKLQADANTRGLWHFAEPTDSPTFADATANRNNLNRLMFIVQPGAWYGQTDQELPVSFVVTEDSKWLRYFTITLSFPGVIIQQMQYQDAEIKNDQFTISGRPVDHYQGTFTSNSSASGTWEGPFEIGSFPTRKVNGSGTWTASPLAKENIGPLTYVSYDLMDGDAEAGKQFTLKVKIRNDNSQKSALILTGMLTTNDGNVTIKYPEGYVPEVPPGQTEEMEFYSIEIAPDATTHDATFHLNLEAGNSSRAWEYEFQVPIKGADDTTPPAPVTDLQVVPASVAETELVLLWTSPGDDGMEGTVSVYDIRYSTEMIDDTNFDKAMKAPNIPKPTAAGSKVRFDITGLKPGTTYFFALKAVDEALNWSEISNVVKGDTLSDDGKPVLKIVQEYQEVGVGKEIVVEIHVEKINDLSGFQINLSFDPEILEALNAEEGDFLKAGGGTHWLPPQIDNKRGKIMKVACAILGVDAGVSGSGALARITFKTKALGESLIDFSEYNLMNSKAELIDANSQPGKIHIGDVYAEDVNGDGVIDIMDLILVGKCFGATVADGDCKLADVNDDANIDIFDLVRVGRRFGQTWQK